MDENIGVISSMIVQARPEKLETITTELKAFPGIEISARDPSGKIIVVLEAENDRQLADTMNDIGNIAGVLGVNLVYHHNEHAN
ncbi:chaperone NapD [Thalassospira lucentensis]|uniref:chaperone NapD n=1 Tax=Thalassospira lucentensis TaxID=168935 RepID=UPI00142D97A3|nr:chaperone NapD [Thalassospira lucentensis]NIZ00063.1 chaperone NapD [Thalassospira lucentensis]